jgi:hypothetical protein
MQCTIDVNYETHLDITKDDQELLHFNPENDENVCTAL